MDLDDFSPLARLQVRARKIRITHIADLVQFWPIFAQKCLGFCMGKFFSCVGKYLNLAAEFPHYYSDPVDRLYKFLISMGAK